MYAYQITLKQFFCIQCLLICDISPTHEGIYLAKMNLRLNITFALTCAKDMDFQRWNLLVLSSRFKNKLYFYIVVLTNKIRHTWFQLIVIEVSSNCIALHQPTCISHHITSFEMASIWSLQTMYPHCGCYCDITSSQCHCQSSTSQSY